MKSPSVIKYVGFVLLLLVLNGRKTIIAQAETESTPVHFKDTVWYDKGFDFYIGGGMFFANKYNANYYNGRADNECNLHYVFDNRYWRDDILEEVVKNYSYISTSDSIYYREEDLPRQMNYKIKMGISLGVRYKISDGWAVSLSYSLTRLVASDQFLLSYHSVSGNQYDQPIMILYGKEDRSLFDLSGSYVTHFSRIVRPFFELGVQFNYAEAKTFYTQLQKGSQQYTLLDPYGGESYVPGAQMTTYKVHYGGPGFGASAALGVKFVFNKTVSIDPTFYVSASRLGMKGYKDIALSYAALIRIVMTDFFISRQSR